MKRALKIVGYLLSALLVILLAVVAYLWPQVSSFPSLPSAYEAKELCSCMFVEGRTQDACEKFIRQDVVPIDGRSFDTANKKITVKALWIETSAKYVSPQVGCVLEE